MMIKNLFTFLIVLTLGSVLTNDALAFKSNADSEKNRGVVAIKSGESMFISWRLFESDPEGIGFNVYRSNEEESNVLLNDVPITHGTNYKDHTVDFSKSNTYTVTEVSADGTELTSSSARVAAVNRVSGIEANTITINLRPGPEIHFAWIGDLDGDGDYDYIIDRLDWGNGCYLEAYTNDGTFMWDIDYGPNSANMNNISPGSATIDVGHWDGVTVADLDGDGQAEVISKVADGVRLGNGFVWNGGNSNNQWLVILDGATGGWKADARIPDDYIGIGPVATQLGVGNNNEVFMHAKNRNSNGSFNIIDAVYTYDGGSNFYLKWRTLGGGSQAHNIRVVDVNSDGVDDLAHIGYVRDGNNGNVLYTLNNIIHGDRFHIGKFDPSRPGLQGYGVQQDSWHNIVEYYYDASTGQILWTNPGGYDNGRGNVADIDPRYPGYEVWSFEGVHNGPSGQQITNGEDDPWPNFRIWWDGDNGSELFDNGDIEFWNYQNGWTETLVDCGSYGAEGSYRGAPLFYGDFLGDWREEVIMKNWNNTQLIIFTTDIPTSISRPSLMEDRYYRNDLTVKGYMQSHHTSYYIGEGGCNPTSLTSYVQVNGGSWQGTTSVTVDSGDEVRFGPQPVSGGSWSWSGCGTSGSSREQVIYHTSSCTATATFTNSCGAQSSININITVQSSYYQLQNRATGLFLDGMGRTANGDPVGQYANTTHPNSHWELVDTGDGYYQLQNRGTGLFLDGMGRTTNGDDCGQYANTNHPNSHWDLQQYSGNYYRIQNRGTGLFLDGMGRSVNGDAAGQWANTTSYNAQWQLVSMSSSRAHVITHSPEILDIQFFPNPMEDELNILLRDQDGKADLKIFNVSGQVMLSAELNELENKLDVQNLAEGVYFVEVATASRVERFKLIKE